MLQVVSGTGVVHSDDDTSVGGESQGASRTAPGRGEGRSSPSEQRLLTFLSAIPGMAYRCRNDHEWTMEFVSAGCFPLTGWHRTDVILNRRVSYNDIIHPDDREMVWESVQAALAEKRQYCLVYRIITDTGQEKWVLEQGVGVFDEAGRLEALEGLITDITERVLAEEALRKAHRELEQRVQERTRELAEVNARLQEEIEKQRCAEDALRASEERFRVAFEEAPVGMIIGVGDGVISRVNRALCRMTGYEPEEMIGRNVRDFIHPEDLDLSAELVPKLLEGEITSFTLERRYIVKGGRIILARTTTAGVFNSDGSLAFALGTLDDITEQKAAREALEQERQTLRHLLRASDHERQVIAYDIHDGLAQQLTAAIMQFQIYEHLRESEPEQCATAYAAGFQMLQRASAEARRLISGVRPPILDESGITAALAHLVHDRRKIDGLDIEFVSRVAFDRLPQVLENAIYRMAQEALTNACQHSQSAKVRVSLIQEGNFVTLEVQDWGVGFYPDVAGREGFGLEGIRERARLVNGTATVESHPGTGTRVQVAVPIV
ncbi:MAG: PAS domain S-box protein [Planctomycetota bacterium]